MPCAAFPTCFEMYLGLLLTKQSCTSLVLVSHICCRLQGLQILWEDRRLHFHCIVSAVGSSDLHHLLTLMYLT